MIRIFLLRNNNAEKILKIGRDFFFINRKLFIRNEFVNFSESMCIFSDFFLHLGSNFTDFRGFRSKIPHYSQEVFR